MKLTLCSQKRRGRDLTITAESDTLIVDLALESFEC